MTRDCPHFEDVPAFVSGDLPSDAAVEFLRHLDRCRSCAEAKEAAEAMVGRLWAMPAPVLSGDLTRAIMGRVRREEKRVAFWGAAAGWGAAAALVGLLAAGAALFFGSSRVPTVAEAGGAGRGLAEESLERSLEWLVRSQETDGSWNPSRWGGQRNYHVALTALPLMALTAAQQPVAGGDEAVSRAVGHLLRCQNLDGSFGMAFNGKRLNSHLATLALLHVYGRERQEFLEEPLRFAMGALRMDSDAAADPAVRPWADRIAELAPGCGFGSLSMSSGSASPMAGVSVGVAGVVAPEAGRFDYFQAYVAVAQLRHSQEAGSRQRLAALRERLVHSQVTAGSESGSWSPEDAGGRVGGRLYATALASMALE